MTKHVLVGLVLVGGLTLSAAAQSAPGVGEQLTLALQHYNELNFEDGITVAEGILDRDDLNRRDSVAAYEILSLLTYALGEEYMTRSLGYLEKISQVGPCVIHLPRELWPQQLRDRWYYLANQANALMCGDEGEGVTTIAVLPFDNYSIGEYQEKLGLLSHGLAEFFAHDFRKASSLTVIERDKIDFLLQELELTKAGAVDAATAAKVGKLLGAQYMVFGSITQMDDDEAKFLVRTVDVETSEIVATAEREGKPKYLRMQKELVDDLAKQLNLALGSDFKKLLNEGTSASLDAATLYSQGLEYQRNYDYRAAYEAFKQAYELDPKFTEAKRKMDIYRPLVG